MSNKLRVRKPKHQAASKPENTNEAAAPANAEVQPEKTAPAKKAKGKVETVEELQAKIAELQRLENEKIEKQIEEVANKAGVMVGIQMTAIKLADIMLYMVNNKMTTVSLKFEVWKEKK